jgi:NhaC family Na+:H+ antiporter
MMLTGAVPLVITLLIYGIFSGLYPLPVSADLNNSINQMIAEAFNLHGITLLPAMLVLVLAITQVNAKLTLFLSWLLACLIAITLQVYSISDVINFTLWGFQLSADNALDQMLRGGGLWLMGKVCLVVVLSTGLAGLLTRTKSLYWINNWLKTARTQRSLFTGTVMMSLLSAAFGCTQTIAVVLTHQLVSPQYRQQGYTPYRVATDLENTAILLAAVIPWNIAGLVPMTLIMGDVGCIPYAIYLYLVPLYNWIWLNSWKLEPNN